MPSLSRGSAAGVSTSTWDHDEVRRRLTAWAGEFVDPDAPVIDDTGFSKDGKDSPGVARMYRGALGKTGNCQVGVSVHAVTDWASAAIDWWLFLPKSWDDEKAVDEQAAAEIRARRARSVIPERARHREKWRWRWTCSTRSPGGVVPAPAAGGGRCRLR